LPRHRPEAATPGRRKSLSGSGGTDARWRAVGDVDGPLADEGVAGVGGGEVWGVGTHAVGFRTVHRGLVGLAVGEHQPGDAVDGRRLGVQRFGGGVPLEPRQLRGQVGVAVVPVLAERGPRAVLPGDQRDDDGDHTAVDAAGGLEGPGRRRTLLPAASREGDVSGPRVAGKALPTAASMADTVERGFERAELHCPARTLDDLDDTVATVRASSLAVASVHTPHVGSDDLELIADADRLARRLDTTLVVHTQYLQHTRLPAVEALGLASDRAYENNPGASVHHLETILLDAGHDLVVDSAHLYMAHEDYVERFADLLARYGDRIPVVHLTDGTLRDDGMPFGEGTVDLPAVGRVLKERHVGTVVLEVMPDHQRAALERFREF